MKVRLRTKDLYTTSIDLNIATGNGPDPEEITSETHDIAAALIDLAFQRGVLDTAEGQEGCLRFPSPVDWSEYVSPFDTSLIRGCCQEIREVAEHLDRALGGPGRWDDVTYDVAHRLVSYLKSYDLMTVVGSQEGMLFFD